MSFLLVAKKEGLHVLRLSIVIPALCKVELLESSLVSVLQNRPADTEVLIVHAEPYSDPHGLAGEVRFVPAERGATLVQTANAGFRHARAPVVHLLGCGAEVTDGWTDEPLRHFAEDRVAAVASLVLNLKRPQRALSAGVTFSRGGHAARRGEGRRATRAAAANKRVLGPSSLSAFYRKSVLVRLGGFEPWAGDLLADVEMALRIRELGMECRFEPQSLVYAEPSSPIRGFAASRAAERLYRRHARQLGWTAKALHPLTILGECLLSFPRPSMLTGPLGRWAAQREGTELFDPSVPKLAASPTAAKPADRPGLRLDSPHPAGQARSSAPEKRQSWARASE